MAVHQLEIKALAIDYEEQKEWKNAKQQRRR